MNYLKYIVLAQIIGCLFVILGHSYPFVTPLPQWTLDTRWFIYCFHMPLFVFCSGFLFKYTCQSRKKTFLEYVKKRFKRILIPYFVLSIIGILPKCLFASVLNDSLQFDAISLTRTFLVPRENVWGHFWFLPMIFFLGVITYVMDKYFRKSKSGIMDGGGVLLLFLLLRLCYTPVVALEWFGINDIIKYGWCFYLGFFVCGVFGDVKGYLKMSNLQIILTGGAFL